VTAVWENDGTHWQLIAPVGFRDEAASDLEVLVSEAMMPSDRTGA
jgi:hypothetical protein